MSKYASLWEYIARTRAQTLTFDEIKSILGFPIDHSFLNCKKELNEYGYEVQKISLKEETVLFGKMKTR